MCRYSLFFVFVLLVACSGEREPRDFSSVEITPVYSDSTSIRAISPVNDSAVWFAGSAGKVGLIDGTTPKLATIQYGDSLLSFRSIAKTKSAVFMLSIGSPAVLYKIGLQDNEANSMEEVYVEEGKAVFYNAMAFWDDKQGIAVGDPVGECLSVIITRDGGNSWQKVPCSQLPKTVAGEAGFAASNSNIALVDDHVWVVSGGQRSRVFYSPDRGTNWEVFDTPIQEGGSMTGIYSVAFYDTDNGVVFGGDWNNKSDNRQNKAATKDGGKTWQLLSDGKGPGYCSSVRFVPEGAGKEVVAVGPSGVFYSHTGGNSWKTLSDHAFFAVEFVNDTLAFASGNGQIAKLVFRE